MPWIAPVIERPDFAEPLVGDERTMLEARLEWQRTTLLAKCTGLTGTQLAARVVPPSNLSLLGLLRHVTQVERTWFQRAIGGRDAPRAYPPGGADFNAAEAVNAESDYAALVAEMEASRSAVAAMDLDHEFSVTMWNSRPASVRWNYIHMIEEYARHNGHADFLRERIDGVTGH
jgi:uncharacterized damage-inducible protein DinB